MSDYPKILIDLNAEDLQKEIASIKAWYVRTPRTQQQVKVIDDHGNQVALLSMEELENMKESLSIRKNLELIYAHKNLEINDIPGEREPMGARLYRGSNYKCKVKHRNPMKHITPPKKKRK